jgi:hypothetical protein
MNASLEPPMARGTAVLGPAGLSNRQGLGSTHAKSAWCPPLLGSEAGNELLHASGHRAVLPTRRLAARLHAPAAFSGTAGSVGLFGKAQLNRSGKRSPL